MRFTRLQDWLAWQETLHSQKIELGLDRIAQVAKAMGVLQPDYKVITVAGTNGKGSIVAVLESIYHHAGYRVATYTSPHLLHYNERIKIRQINVDDETLCNAFDLVDQARGEISLSYFEFGTLAAMQIFNDTELDVAIYEVGLGGRLDAVNIIDTDLAIISSIGIDHVQWLGTTRESIGFEKAGILRSQRPAICGDEKPPKSLINYAKEIGSTLYKINDDYSFERNNGGLWSFKSSKLDWKNLPAPNVYGDAQISNAATAIMAVEILDEVFPVTRECVDHGLSEIKLLGRFQRLAGDCDIILDVAHNLDSIQVLVDNLQELKPANNTYAVFAVLADKDVDGIIEIVKGIFDKWFISKLDGERALDCEILESKLAHHCSNCKWQSYPSISQAYLAAKQAADASSRIVVFGSFLTVAEALSQEV